jgi:hypothetical protein
MKIHQVRWSSEERDKLQFNKLSCFSCEGKCSHFYLNQILYDVPKTPVPEQPDLTKVPVCEASTLESSSDQLQIPICEASTLESSSDQLHTQVTSTHNFKVLDWVVTKFTCIKKKREQKFIGQIVGLKEDNIYEITFLRPKKTKHFAGFVYTYPLVPDLCDCTHDQVLYKLVPPEDYQRCLKFNTHCDKL